jgi:hypothetical protein
MMVWLTNSATSLDDPEELLDLRENWWQIIYLSAKAYGPSIYLSLVRPTSYLLGYACQRHQSIKVTN